MTKNRISLIALSLILISLILNNSQASEAIKDGFNTFTLLVFVILIILLIRISIKGKKQ